MNIAVFKVSHSALIDKDTTALRAVKARSSSIQLKARSRMQAHISSGVVMDIAAFKVSHAAGADKDATTLQAKKRSA